MRDVGLGAEDVAKVEPLLTFTNSKGEIEGVKYNQLSAVFIYAFKEQQEQIKERERQAGIHEIFDDDDVAIRDVDRQVLEDPHPAAVGRVSGDRQEVDDHVDVNRADQVGEKDRGALQHADEYDAV